MKRWNGWGDAKTDYPLPETGRQFLEQTFGSLEATPDVSIEVVLNSIPTSRLRNHPLVNMEPKERLIHARGQSLPDWVALRHGKIPAFPDGVAFPQNADQVRELILYAKQSGATIIPYGGGTSVVGHINTPISDKPVLVLSMEKMTRMLEMDTVGHTAVFEAGIAGPELEGRLGEHGYTLGHFPQSHEFSTLGGWIASRSSGQQSYHYGRIEQLFAGGSMETPCGTIVLPHFPASAAGPDVKEMVLGSEGRMGILTHARVRISPVPVVEEFHGIFFPSWEAGMDAVREIAQERVRVSMLRLSNPVETQTTLILSGKAWVKYVERGLPLIGYGSERCLLIFGVTGGQESVRQARSRVRMISRKRGGLFIGQSAGHAWKKSRFLSPYLRNTLWENGITIDTLETAIPWNKVLPASAAIPGAISKAMQARGEVVLAFAHLSHIYRDAASIYTTFLFKRPTDPEALLEKWRVMKAAASKVIQEYGGTITHQHGIGTDHAQYLPAEKGELGMAMIRAACKAFDPQGMMNPGKLLEE